MSKIRSKDTLPEVILRCGLHKLGFRFRLAAKSMSGSPDLIFPKRKAVVFVHGCYWHRHPGCKGASTPKSNVEFWTKKFQENKKRDFQVKSSLEKDGWRVLVVWECELIKKTLETISMVAEWLTPEADFGGCKNLSDYGINREKLLSFASKKVGKRLASYKVSETKPFKMKGE